jgi:peptide-methionine (S)-S-oxide reductase
MGFFISPMRVQSQYMKVIYLGSGGFWITEAVYKEIKGVTEVIPGYMGGSVAYPTHEMVSTGTTGHIEVAKVVYDENIIDTAGLLHIFFALHDPAIPNHPSLSMGSQYRSVIFYTDHNEAEATDMYNGQGIAVIQRTVEEIQDTLPEGGVVATEVISAGVFYAADQSHYDYYHQHPETAYSVTIIAPRLQKVRETFPDKVLL